MAEDWKIRTELLVGKEMLERFRKATVAVIGVGGVGGYAAEMLVRAGIGHLIILDSDTVSVSNKNRQLLAMDSTVGRLKCDVLAQRLLDINPELDLVRITSYLESAYEKDGSLKYDFEKLLSGDCDAAEVTEGQVETDSQPDDAWRRTPQMLLGSYRIDFLVDAIDTLSPKLSLIKYCMETGIPLVSSMGAGAKYDVTRIRITDISKSFACPLAYMVRKRLRRMGVSRGFKVVFSEELPDENAMVPCEETNRKSMVGTISYLPAAFGCACAQAAIQWLLKTGMTKK